MGGGGRIPRYFSQYSPPPITKFGTLEEYGMFFQNAKKLCSLVIWLNYDVITKTIANFGPPRN